MSGMITPVKQPAAKRNERGRLQLKNATAMMSEVIAANIRCCFAIIIIYFVFVRLFNLLRFIVIL